MSEKPTPVKPGTAKRAADGRHQWQGPDDWFPNWPYCASCMVVKNDKNGDNTNCRGQGRIALRESSDAG